MRGTGKVVSHKGSSSQRAFDERERIRGGREE